jgi:phosphoribosylformylglycinamidine (FGAM) synthase-like enzyme
LVRACHDLIEGGLAVAVAEMAFAGGFGAQVDVRAMPADGSLPASVRLFSESNTRFLCEVERKDVAAFEQAFGSLAFAKIGQVTVGARLVIDDVDARLVDADIYDLKEAWQGTLRW